VNHLLTLLTVHGHPDDESVLTGGTMARYAAEGVRVVCVVATRGEVGHIVARDLATPANYKRLGDIRELELTRALERLGPVEHRILGYRDSGMMGARENFDPRALWQADLDEAAGRLVEIVRSVQADVIVSPNAYGGDGHPDHIRAAQLARLAFERAGLENAYEEQLVNGLAPWTPAKLYHCVIQFERREKLVRAFAQGGVREVVPILFRVARHWTPSRERQRARMVSAQGRVTTRIDVGPYLEAKYAALAEHRTQIARGGDLFALSPAERRRIAPTEGFSLQLTRVRSPLPEVDLFAGLRGTG
jgi:N-acetyl-1-D-myo-inositol-2-amino-2-deoxy-alpha-D-glucopyranoside deacetylase